MSLKRRVLIGLGLFVAGAAVLIVATAICIPAWVFHGILVPECPDGGLRQTIYARTHSLRRQASGAIEVGALAHYTTGPADHSWSAPVRRVEASAELFDANGAAVAMKQTSKWEEAGHSRSASFELPGVPDGDYVLKARAKTPLGEGSIDVPIPIYAPARIHVLTDRPLYRPGDTVRFRAVVVRARDLAPLDRRPGRWFILDPRGEALLEERGAAGEWGVASSTFPLDAEAEAGDWVARWTSGNDSGEVRFRVEPFVLPRFRVEVEPSRPFYVVGEQPVLRGTVTYTSGAPVEGANLELSWSSGSWPMPTDWEEEELLPKQTVTDSGGRFVLELPRVPGDVSERVVLSANISATDPAGDRVTGQASTLLAKDKISVQAVTELGGRLVEGFNNRLYLRVSTIAGRVLAKTDLVVKRAWDPSDRGVLTTTDEDGVAALQIDPGPPVNVVIPPPPVRRPPRPPPVIQSDARSLIPGGEISLADQVAMGRWIARLEDCARFSPGDSSEASVVLRADRSGRIVEVAAYETDLSRCTREVISRQNLPAGKERLYALSYAYNDADLPRIELQLGGEPAVPADLHERVASRMRDARICLAGNEAETDRARVLIWRARAGSREIDLNWVDDPDPGEAERIGSRARACVESKNARIAIAEPAEIDALGAARIEIQPRPSEETHEQSPTTLLGYELEVSASVGKEALGSTKIVIAPGEVPQARLRATPVVARAGSKVRVELLRGPGFKGELPEKLWLQHTHRSVEAKLDPETRSATFEIPQGADGWFRAYWEGAQTLVFVPSGQELAVEVRTDRERYAPGEKVQLALQTTAGGRGVPSAVGLFGVDESLAQLVPLPGPDDMSSLRPKVETPSPAFGVLDGQALAMGRIRGENAAAATILQVSQIPTPPDLDAHVYAQNDGRFEPLEALTDHFYIALGELHASARDWEAKAPKSEQMKAETMARLWEEALAACQARGEEVDDAFGRTLRLSRLPADLLALTSPRAVVIDGTRLPEDVEDWEGWVRKEEP